MTNDEVPHFLHDNPPHDEWIKRREEWFKQMGLDLFIAFFYTDPRETMKILNPTVLYILTGMGARGVNHSVVCKADKIIWDPSGYQGDGIVGPCSMEYKDEKPIYWVEVILGTNLSYWNSEYDLILASPDPERAG